MVTSRHKGRPDFATGSVRYRLLALAAGASVCGFDAVAATSGDAVEGPPIDPISDPISDPAGDDQRWRDLPSRTHNIRNLPIREGKFRHRVHLA